MRVLSTIDSLKASHEIRLDSLPNMKAVKPRFIFTLNANIVMQSLKMYFSSSCYCSYSTNR